MDEDDAGRRTRAGFDRQREHGVFRDMLQTLAEGVTEAAGFGVAAISVLRLTDEFETVAVAGDESVRDLMLGRFTPRAVVDAELAVAEEWGTLRYVAHDALVRRGDPGWIPEHRPGDDPDSWRPGDLLLAPLTNGCGDLIGLLSVDLPATGKRPGPEQLERLERYAGKAGRTLAHALHDATLLEEVRLAGAARQIVRRASALLTIEEILHTCGTGLLEAFRANGVWLQTFQDGDFGRALTMTRDIPQIVLPEPVIELAANTARKTWGHEPATILSARRAPDGTLSAEERAMALGYLAEIGVVSLLFVPLGVGDEALGCLALTRGAGQPEWSDNEILIAHDIGQDLGRAFFNAQLFEREQQVARDLRELATYRSQLLSTVAHELRTPLTAILGHADLIEDLTDAGAPSMGSIHAVQRAASRLEAMLGELMTLARVSDPNQSPEGGTVDLAEIAHATCQMLELQAENRKISLQCNVPSHPVLVRGSEGDLERIVVNLVSNAIKYSPDGTRVLLELGHTAGEVRLAVTDQGFGISPEEQDKLFAEFFRSSDERSRAKPGTGLGLAIVRRTVQRYGGTVTVDSSPQEGSTFTVTLPAA